LSPQPVRPELTIRQGEVVLVIGKPGTGKSTLAQWLLRDAGSAIVYETKGDPLEQQDWERAGFVPVHDPMDLDPHPRAMLICRSEWLQKRPGWERPGRAWSRALEHPFHRKPTAVLFDEVLRAFPVGGGHPGTHRILQQGRSFGMVPIILSQAASNIDTLLLRLAQHIFVLGPFRAGADLDYVQRATSSDVKPLARLGKRQIGWWHETAAEWTTFEPLRPDGPAELRPLLAGTVALPYPSSSLPWAARHRDFAGPPAWTVTLHTYTTSR